jgi:RimJ/RimL family protein N-acetyltransferase
MDRAKLQVGLFRALAQGLSRMGEAHVWLMFKKDLQQPLTPFQPKVPMAIELAEPSQMDELGTLFHPDDLEEAAEAAEAYRARFDVGAVCFVARVDGRIVAVDWLRVGAAVGIAEVPMVLQDDEVYGSDAYTAEAWRGRGIHPALNHAMLKYAQHRGYRIAYTTALADNASSLATLRRLGWTLSGTLLVYEPSWAQDRLKWLVLGSPYPMPVAGLASLRLPTLAELYEQQKFDGRELVASMPWSNTYGLRRGDATMYLKIVPQEHAPGLKAAAAVAAAYPEHVPKVVACNPVFESWLLTQDHGGAALDDCSPPPQLFKMIETYAILQARSAANSALLKRLPPAPIDGVVQALLDFLASDAGRDGPAPAGAAFFVGTAEAQRVFDAVRRAQVLLESHVAPARRLPVTLNHGNLQPSHAALAASGDCVIFNWARAMSGPAGLSLHPMLGGHVPRSVLLDAAAGQSSHSTSEGTFLDRYVTALVREGYADEETLRHCLPASITAGMLLDLLYLARYPMEDPDELQIVRDQLRTRIGHVIALCGRLFDAQSQSEAKNRIPVADK